VFVYAVGLRTGRGFALSENLFLPRWGFGSPLSTRNEG
jgi:hypothetical protein